MSYIPLPSVTVLIACYNGSRYIDECLKSLINQQDNQYKLQIICCDDSSTDDSYNFLLSYQEKLPNLITVIKNEKNLGSSLTRARLISCVQTQYFCFCDIDDFYYPNSIKYLLKKSKKGTCDIVTAKTYRIIGKKKRVWWITSRWSPFINANKYLRCDMPYIWSTLYNTNFIHHHNYQFPAFSMFEDVAFCYYHYPLAKKFRMCKKKCYAYRCSPTSMSDVSRIFSKMNRIKEVFLQADYIFSIITSPSYIEKIKRKHYQNMVKNLVYCFAMYFAGIFFVTRFRTYRFFRKKINNYDLWEKCRDSFVFILNKYNLHLQHPGSWWKNLSYFLEIKWRYKQCKAPKPYYLKF